MENYFALEILGKIPERKAYFSRKKTALIYGDDENTDFNVADNYASIAHIVRHKVRKKENSCVYVTSSSQNEGKTTVTAHLAVQLRDNLPYPYEVTLDTAWNTALSNYITQELGIPPDHQYWSGSN